MKKYIEGINPLVISQEVKEVMVKSNTFNRLLVVAIEGVGCRSYTVNEFDALLSTVTPVTVVKVMEENGFALIVENGKIRFTHEGEKEDGMTSMDVAYYFFDTLDKK